MCYTGGKKIQKSSAYQTEDFAISQGAEGRTFVPEEADGGDTIHDEAKMGSGVFAVAAVSAVLLAVVTECFLAVTRRTRRHISTCDFRSHGDDVL